jgi:hypothetical protein
MSACPNCGHQNVELASFCQSCGIRLAVEPSGQPFPRSPITHETQSSVGGGVSTMKIILVIFLIIGVISAISFAVVYYEGTQFINRVSEIGPVEMTGLLLYINYSHGSDNYLGAHYQFLIRSPIYLHYGQTYQANMSLTLQSTVSHSLDSVVLGFSDGFTIQSVSPQLPFAMTPGSSIILGVTIQAPSTNYSGAVTIDLFTH